MSQLRRVTRPEAALLVAVKANAYGHGMVEVARQALGSGADALGVARLDEALRLRKAGIEAPLLVFGYSPPAAADDLINNDIKQAVYSIETAELLGKQAVKAGGVVQVHLKVDTGMGRLGLLPESRRVPTAEKSDVDHAVEEVKQIAAMDGLNLEGIFTHFASADSADKSYADYQFETFRAFLDKLNRAGLKVKVRHAANSGAIIDMPQTHLDMVRAGISLYGLCPSQEVDCRAVHLEPVMALKARVVHVKQVPAGFKISYGMTFETDRPTTIATIPIGYADGYSRLLTNRGSMLVRGQRAPIVGRVCMDLTMIDVGHIPGVKPEDEVVILGRQGEEIITADEIAGLINTINYEVVSSITARVPRIFI